MLKREYINKLSDIVEVEYAQQLREAGFAPQRDFTEWFRIVNGEVVQTIVFMLPFYLDITITWRTQMLSEYLRIDWQKQHNFELYSANEWDNPQTVFKSSFNPIYQAIKYPNHTERRVKEMHETLDKLIPLLDGIDSAKAIYCDKLRTYKVEPEKWLPILAGADIESIYKDIWLFGDKLERERPNLIFEATDNVQARKRAVMSAQHGLLHYGAPPKRITSYDKWIDATKLAANEALEKDDLGIYDEFVKRCAEENTQILKERVPDLFAD